MAAPAEADYVIVGGGLTGCVVASHLKQRNPALDILVIEAGIDPSNDQRISSFPGLFSLLGSEFDWSYHSAPQPATANRVHVTSAGKALGGGTTINFGGWNRRDASDYDQWGRTVDDQKWSYDGLLPFFRRSETFASPNVDIKQHGVDGPIHVTPVSATRAFPLREPTKEAWAELGLVHNPEICSGKLAGICDFFETWYEGQRQTAYKAYGLAGIQVITEATVHRVEFEVRDDNQGSNPEATAVLLVDGRTHQSTQGNYPRCWSVANSADSDVIWSRTFRNIVATWNSHVSQCSSSGEEPGGSFCTLPAVQDSPA